MDIVPYSSDHTLVALSGALPAIAAMLYFDWLDRKRPEPWGLRYLVTFFGMLSVIPVLILAVVIEQSMGDSVPAAGTYEHAAFLSFGLAAGVEEACKITAVFIVVWHSKRFDERMDGLVYGARAGLGFALVENCLYIYNAVIEGQWVTVWILRALLAVPGHAIWSGMMGYFAARRRFDHAGPGLLGGYLIAVLLHGVYDMALFAQVPLAADGLETAAAFLLLVPVLVSVVGWRMIRRMAQTALHLDDAAAARGGAAAFS
jgi:RsiW-degrading membrane proteinase PrsW (M82 family)